LLPQSRTAPKQCYARPVPSGAHPSRITWRSQVIARRPRGSVWRRGHGTDGQQQGSARPTHVPAAGPSTRLVPTTSRHVFSVETTRRGSIIDPPVTPGGRSGSVAGSTTRCRWLRKGWMMDRARGHALFPVFPSSNPRMMYERSWSQEDGRRASRCDGTREGTIDWIASLPCCAGGCFFFPGMREKNTIP